MNININDFYDFWRMHDSILRGIESTLKKFNLCFRYQYLDYEAFICKKKDYLPVHIYERFGDLYRISAKQNKIINDFISKFDGKLKLVSQNNTNFYILTFDRADLESICGLIQIIK